VTESDVRDLILKKTGVRIEPEMARYVLKQVQSDRGSGPSKAFPIIGADARTGMPLRQMVEPQVLNA